MSTRAPACLALLVALAGAACSPKHWDWNRMRMQARYHPYGPSGVFANGLAMQHAPLGTVSYESPADSTQPPDTTRGAHHYAIACAVCHGTRGDGNSLVGRNMEPPRPPSLLSPSVRALSDATLDSVIHFGRGRMPPLGAALTAQARRDLIAYLHTLPATP